MYTERQRAAIASEAHGGEKRAAKAKKKADKNVVDLQLRRMMALQFAGAAWDEMHTTPAMRRCTRMLG